MCGAAATAANHPLFARVWARTAGSVVPDWYRAKLLEHARGRVLEIGCGDGRNFRHYPRDVREVVAIEPEPYLRSLAERAAAAAPVPVRVLAAAAEDLPVGDGDCDLVVAVLVLCSVTDQPGALAEIRRALAPGGELRFYEHVVARRALGAGAQRRLDESGVWPGLAGGCHLARDTVAAIRASGLTVERLRRFPSGPGPLGLPIAQGVARRS